MTKLKFLLVGVVIVFGFGLFRAMNSEVLENVHFIKDGERVCSSNSECRFLEYAENETFENTDTYFYMKFNSSDVHRVIHAGLTCERVKVVGWRVPFMSWFRNIVWVENCK